MPSVEIAQQTDVRWWQPFLLTVANFKKFIQLCHARENVLCKTMHTNIKSTQILDAINNLCDIRRVYPPVAQFLEWSVKRSQARFCTYTFLFVRNFEFETGKHRTLGNGKRPDQPRQWSEILRFASFANAHMHEYNSEFFSHWDKFKAWHTFQSILAPENCVYTSAFKLHSNGKVTPFSVTNVMKTPEKSNASKSFKCHSKIPSAVVLRLKYWGWKGTSRHACQRENLEKGRSSVVRCLPLHRKVGCWAINQQWVTHRSVAWATVSLQSREEAHPGFGPSVNYHHPNIKRWRLANNDIFLLWHLQGNHKIEQR